VKGFSAIMPVFQGQVSEDDLIKLIAYLHSLNVAPAPAAASSKGTNP
jgi:hypothetical protein